MLRKDPNKQSWFSKPTLIPELHGKPSGKSSVCDNLASGPDTLNVVFYDLSNSFNLATLSFLFGKKS